MKRPPDEIAQKLIEASAGFTGTGFDLSMDEVAQATDIPRATLYYYFSGKDDLVAFYLNHKLDTVREAIGKAAAYEGSASERLEMVVHAVLCAMSDHPALCTELPAALRHLDDYPELVANAERTVMAPVREILVDGVAAGEFNIPDVDTAVVAFQGAVAQTALSTLLRFGSFDPDDLTARLVPLVIDGLKAR